MDKFNRYRAIKVRLYIPTHDSIDYINGTMGTYRFIYNYYLNYSKEQSDIGNKTNLNDWYKHFHNILTKDVNYSWLGLYNTKVCKEALRDLEVAFKRFFKKTSAYPRFKRKSNEQSARFNYEAFSKRMVIDNNHLKINNKLTDVRFETSKRYRNILINNRKNIKSVTISRNRSGQYHGSFLLIDNNNELKNNKISKYIKSINETSIEDLNITGYDLGIKTFLVGSNGDSFQNIKSYRSEEKKIKKLQRRYSRKEKESNNKHKARIKLAKAYNNQTNKKEQYLHLTANKMVNENQVIVIEDLNVESMMQNHKVAKSIQELSFNKFKTILQQKCLEHDRELIIIDKWFPSTQICSCCGNKKEGEDKLTLKDRTYNCFECGLMMDRDLNASINIMLEGLRIIMKQRVFDDDMIVFEIQKKRGLFHKSEAKDVGQRLPEHNIHEGEYLTHMN